MTGPWDQDNYDEEAVDTLDPDRDDVPMAALAADGTLVTVTDLDGTVSPAMLCVIPAFHAHKRRMDEGFYDDLGDAR